MARFHLIPAAFALAAFAASAGAQDSPANIRANGLNPLSSLDTSDLRGFRGRPLFAPSRRPVSPPPPVAEIAQPEAAAAAKPNLRLTGVIESPDESVAVVRNLDIDETWQLRLGDQIGGWLVTSIEPFALKLTLGERDEQYRLFSTER